VSIKRRGAKKATHPGFGERFPLFRNGERKNFEKGKNGKRGTAIGKAPSEVFLVKELTQTVRRTGRNPGKERPGGEGE